MYHVFYESNVKGIRDDSRSAEVCISSIQSHLLVYLIVWHIVQPIARYYGFRPSRLMSIWGGRFRKGV